MALLYNFLLLVVSSLVHTSPCFWTEVYAPVCGFDGVTYSNTGEADCRGAIVECDGVCPCPIHSIHDGLIKRQGENLCEGYNWDWAECDKLSCCQWNPFERNESGGHCWYAHKVCPVDDILYKAVRVQGEGLCEESHLDYYECGYASCCQWDDGRCWWAGSQCSKQDISYITGN